MHWLELITTLTVGLMIGNELTVTLFINPSLWRTTDMALTSMFARQLGRFMPFWYGVNLILLGLVSYLHRGDPRHGLLLAAALGWLAIILLTILILVPINNQIVLGIGVVEFWRRHHLWDRLHRVRVFLLLVCFVLFLLGV
jgi:hypothetical protein